MVVVVVRALVFFSLLGVCLIIYLWLVFSLFSSIKVYTPAKPLQGQRRALQVGMDSHIDDGQNVD